MKNKKYILIDGNGHQTSLDSYKDNDLALNRLVNNLRNRGKKSPPNITLQKLIRIGWFFEEPGSDRGHFRYYPNGTIIYSLINKWINERLTNLFQSRSVITPMIYNWSQKSIREQADIFSDQIYYVSTTGNKSSHVLRFNGDVGLFQLMSNAQLTYRHLPIRMHEVGQAFRYMKKGQLASITRGRSFMLTDMHSFCADLKQGQAEYLDIFKLQKSMALDVGITLATQLKIPETLLADNLPFIAKLSSADGKPLVVELLPEQKQYWYLKHICHTHYQHKLFHIQLDLEDGPRYKISYTNQYDKKDFCVIIHSSFGTAERWILLTMEKALAKDKPTLPLWLAPVQIRFIPVNEEKHLEYCLSMAKMFSKKNIRADVDDRQKGLNWKIRQAEQGWINIIAVCGDNEMSSNSLAIRDRSLGSYQSNPETLLSGMQQQLQGFPTVNWPRLRVSKMPIFTNRKQCSIR